MTVASPDEIVERACKVAESFATDAPTREQIRDSAGCAARPGQLDRLYDLFASIEDLVVDPDIRPVRGSEFREIGGAVGCDHPDPADWATAPAEVVEISIGVMAVVHDLVAFVDDNGIGVAALIERRKLAIALACEAIRRSGGDLDSVRRSLFGPGDAGASIADLVAAGRSGLARQALRRDTERVVSDSVGVADDHNVIELGLRSAIGIARRFVGRETQVHDAESTWHGTVTSVDDTTFDADLFETTTRATRDVTIAIDRMPPEVRGPGGLWPGRTFELRTYVESEGPASLTTIHRAEYEFELADDPRDVDAAAEQKYVESHLRLEGR